MILTESMCQCTIKILLHRKMLMLGRRVYYYTARVVILEKHITCYNN